MSVFALYFACSMDLVFEFNMLTYHAIFAIGEVRSELEVIMPVINKSDI